MAKGITLPIVFKSDTKGVSQAESALAGFKKTVLGIGAVIGTAFSITAISNFAKEAISAAEGVATANSRIAQIAKTTNLFGESTSAVTGRLIKFAEAQEMRLAVDAEVIKSVQGQLLTFKALGKTAGETGGIFDRTTEAAFNMASAGFGSAETNAIQLGKALEDPIRGLTALRRSGTTFTKEQENLIKTLVESGNLLGAQELILGELESQYGGVAEATARASDRIALAFDNIKESVGGVLLPIFEDLVERLLPVLEIIGVKLTDAVEGSVPSVDDLATIFAELRNTARDVLQFFGPLIEAFGRGVDLLPRLNPVVEQLSDFFGKLAKEGLGLFVTFGAKLIDSVLPVLIDALTKLAPPVVEIANSLLKLFLPVIETLANIALPILVAILKVVSPILTVLATIVSNTTTPIVVMVGVIWGAIRAFAAFKAIMLLVQAVQIGVAAATYGVAGATYAQTTASKLAFIATNLLNGTYLLQAGALVTNTVHMLASRAALIATTVATNAAAAAQWLLNAAMTANPMGLILAALAAVTVALIWFFTNTEAGRAIIAGTLEFFKIAFEAFALGFTTIFTKTLPAAGESFMEFLRGVGTFFVGFGEGFYDVLKSIGGFFKDAINGYIDLWEGFLNFFINGLNSLISGLNKLSVNLPATRLTPAVNFGVNIPKIPNLSIPRLAEGGIVTSPTLAMIGEGGESEAVIPLSKMGKTGSTYNITVNAGLGADGNRIGEEIVRQITRFERLSGPVFARA